MQKVKSARISVIILAYNEEATLGRCLDSVVNQSAPADEIIVINNNSTDRTADIAASYPGIKVIDEPQQGFIPARNRGFNEAANPIMVRCDADGVMPPAWLAAVRDLFMERPTLLGASGPVYYHDLFGFDRIPFPMPGNQAYMKLVGCWPTLVGPNMVITKKAWQLVKHELHDNDKIVHEDMDLAIHVSQYGEIAYDRRLALTTSARRMVGEPTSFFLEYPIRNLRTVLIHWPQLRQRAAGKLTLSGRRSK